MISKYAICFASSILRYRIMTACQKKSLDTNDMIQKMDRSTLLLPDSQEYRFVRDMSLKARTRFSEFSMTIDSFEVIARDNNRRRSQPINSQVHTFPGMGNLEKRRRGTHPENKKKKTIELEATMTEAKAKGEYVEPLQRKKGMLL